MNKKTKIIFSILGTASLVFAPMSIIIASKSNNLSGGISVVGQGSSSVNPIMNTITKHTIYDIQYTANGSGEGLNSQKAIKPLSAFGMMSSKKYPKKQNEIFNWKNNNIRTVTFAIDAISIVLNLPNTIHYPKGSTPIIDIVELSKLYDVSSVSTTTWRSLLVNESSAVVDNQADLDSTPDALGRDGGKEASGTSDGFWHTLKKHMSGHEVGDYNHEHLPIKNKTPEANSQTLNVLKQRENSITYVSLGYAVKNQNSNAIVASIKSNSEVWIPSEENVKNGTYKWTRPFNVAYSIDNNQSLEFASYLLSPTVQKLIAKDSFIPLTVNQISSQLPLDEDDESRAVDFTNGDNVGLSI